MSSRINPWAAALSDRALVKAVSYRLIGSLATFGIAWTLTGDVRPAALIGGSEAFVKITLYYVHERAWEILPGYLQRKRKPAGIA